MKKLLYLLTFISSFAFAQTTVRMSATATGTNTYSCLFNPNVAAFNSSTIYAIPFTNANSSGTITLDPDSGGPGAAVSIKGDDGNDLAVGAIKAGGTYQFKFNGTLLRMIGSAGGAAGWLATGTTNVTDPTIDAGTGTINFQSTGGSSTLSFDGSVVSEGLYYSSATNNFTLSENLFDVALSNGIIHFASGSGIGSDLQMTANFVVQAELDILLSAGTTGSGKDILLEAGSGTIDLTSDFLTINGSAGTATHVLTSNGAGAAPTWQAAAGAGWSVTGTTNLTGDATIDNGVHNLLIGDITGPWSSWDVDGTGPAGIPNSRSDGIGDPLGTTHSYLRHAVSGDDSEALLSVKNATGSEESYIVANATPSPGINLGTTGDLRFYTSTIQRFNIEANGEWGLGAGEDPGTSGDVLQSNGPGAEPTWVAPSGGATISDTAFGVGWNGNTTDGASKNALYDEIILKSTIASPTFTGTPAAPTAAFGTNTTQVATTAFVQAAHGTWTDWSGSLAPTGFSATTLVSSWYIDNGKTVTIWMEVTGTSNATTFTVTLPIAISANYSAVGIVNTVFVVNNSISAVGRIVIAGGSTTVTIDPTITGGSWTASGSKQVRVNLTYQK